MRLAVQADSQAAVQAASPPNARRSVQSARHARPPRSKLQHVQQQPARPMHAPHRPALRRLVPLVPVPLLHVRLRPALHLPVLLRDVPQLAMRALAHRVHVKLELARRKPDGARFGCGRRSCPPNSFGHISFITRSFEADPLAASDCLSSEGRTGGLNGKSRSSRFKPRRAALTFLADVMRQFLDLSTSLFAPIQGIIPRSSAPVFSIGCASAALRDAFNSGCPARLSRTKSFTKRPD